MAAPARRHLFDFIGCAAIAQRSMDVKFHFGPIQSRDESKCNKAALPSRKARHYFDSSPLRSDPHICGEVAVQ